MLKLRLDWTADVGVRAVLAFRTDPDRQGESQDVRTWPDWADPRVGAVLHGLLSGLAPKVVRYATPNINDLTAYGLRTTPLCSFKGPHLRWFQPTVSLVPTFTFTHRQRPVSMWRTACRLRPKLVLSTYLCL